MLERSEWIALARSPRVDATAWAAAQRGEADADEIARLRAAIDPSARSAVESSDVVTPADAAWPECLRQLPDPPAALWWAGDPSLLEPPAMAIAIVGARRASRRALADAHWLSGDLARAGLVVASGLALGIDAAAHTAALDAGGATIAVLGCGLDRSYPARNRALAARIRDHGLVLSEFAPGTPPLAHHFPRRNRIISGLSRGVLVVEASERSGSMITARLAGAQGRDVFAVPSVPRDPGAAGCLRLLREGAALVRSAQDVLDELGIAAAGEPVALPFDESFGDGRDGRDGCLATDVASEPKARSRSAGRRRPVAPAAAAVPEALRPLAPILAGDGATFETLLAAQEASQMDASALARTLTEYEIEGWIARDGERWCWLGAP